MSLTATKIDYFFPQLFVLGILPSQVILRLRFSIYIRSVGGDIHLSSESITITKIFNSNLVIHILAAEVRALQAA